MKRISSEELLANPWHIYRRDRVERRDGSRGDYYYIDHPESVAVLGQDRDDSFLVLRCFRYLFKDYLPQVVLGSMTSGGDIQEEARREFREEAGYLAGELIHLGDFTSCSGLSNDVCHAFLARDLKETERELEATEEIDVLRLNRDQAREYLLSGPLVDGQSLSTWLLFEAWERQQ